jgi:hypothetical protein
MARPKKPEGETVARLGLTLPPDLKAEMDAVPEQVNWSAVAAEAFRRKLTLLQTERRKEPMVEVIKRMQAAEVLDADELYQEGRQAGDEWTRMHGTAKMLRRLDKVLEQFDSIEHYVGVCANGMNEGSAVCIYRDLTGKRNGKADDAPDFWENVVGLGADWREKADDERFAVGFVEAAMELWEKIEQQL